MKVSLKTVALIAASALFSAVGASAVEYTTGLSHRGASISRGLKISLFSRLIVVEPPWGEKYVNTFHIPEKFVTAADAADGRSKRTMSYDRETFKINEYSTTELADGVEILLDGVLDKDAEALVEYSALMIPARLVENATYEATLADGSTATGDLNDIPIQVTTTVKDFTKLVIHTATGDIVIEVLEGAPMLVSDRRGYGFDVNDVDADTKGLRIALDDMLPDDHHLRHKMLVKFEFTEKSRLAMPLESAAVTAFSPDRTESAAPPPTVLPAPRNAVYGNDFYRPSPGAPLTVKLPAGNSPYKLANAICGTLNDRLGFSFSHTDEAKDAPNGGITVTVAPDDASLPRDDGYTLAVTPDGAVIRSTTERGAFMAAQSLAMLARDGAFRCAEITDAPDLKLRGALIMPDADSLANHASLIRNVFVPMKMNTLYLECEYAAWDSCPELHRPWSISKSDLAKLIELARENYMDVIPLFQTYGHCEWMFYNGAHAEMAENPERPITYNASDPNVHPFVTPILDECMELFQPSELHIGHDEVDNPVRPENQAIGAAELFLRDVAFYSEYARKHGVGIQLWNDMFIACSEGRPTHHDLDAHWDRLPKDAVVCFWNYGTKINRDGIAKLRAAGFDVIGCTWFKPANNRLMAELCLKNNCRGLMVTTWAGYNGSSVFFRHSFRQGLGYLFGGSRAWNVADDRVDGVAGELMFKLMNWRRPAADDGSFRAIDLSKAVNLDLAPANHPFADYKVTGIENLDAAYAGSNCDVDFQFYRAPSGSLAAVALTSSYNPFFPGGIEGIPVNRKVAKFHFLNLTLPGGSDSAYIEDEPVAEYIVHYDDGSQATLPVRYRREVNMPLDYANLDLPPWRSVSWTAEDGATRRVFVMSAANPFPEKRVAKLDLRGNGSPYALFSATAEVIDE